MISGAVGAVRDPNRLSRVALAARLFVAFDGSTENDLPTRVFVGPCGSIVVPAGRRGSDSSMLKSLGEGAGEGE